MCVWKMSGAGWQSATAQILGCYSLFVTLSFFKHGVWAHPMSKGDTNRLPVDQDLVDGVELQQTWLLLVNGRYSRSPHTASFCSRCPFYIVITIIIGMFLLAVARFLHPGSWGFIES